MLNVQRPTPGRIVNAWINPDQQKPWPAMVIEVSDYAGTMITIGVFTSAGYRTLERVLAGEGYEAGPRWNWPARE